MLVCYWKCINADRVKVNNLMNFGRRYIYEDDAAPSKYNTLCEKMIAKLIRNIIMILAGLLGSYTLIGCGAFYAMVLFGERITFLGTELPFVDGNTVNGFLINMLEQILLICSSIVGNITIEVGECCVHNAFEAIPEIIHLECIELNSELCSNGVSLVAKMRLRNISMKVQDFNRYS